MKYVNDLNTLILVSLLKEHNIKKIVVSPGTTNIGFVISVQNDPWFSVYSAVDERSASFIACGLADASGEPVVLSCTGATASRNYLPGLTEAYYRKLPILAITSSQNNMKCESYSPQFIDRTRQFNDLVKYSFQAMTITENEKNCYITQINKAILELTHNTIGPVHINLEFAYSGKFVDCLPKIRKICRVKLDDQFPIIPTDSKIGIFVGSHFPFSKNEEDIIDKFCAQYNAIVICDQTSNFRGKYRYLANLANQQNKILSSRRFDLLIHIGTVSGAYIPLESKETWRVNEDGEVRDLFGNLTCVFQMKEEEFFSYYADNSNKKPSSKLLETVKSERESIIQRMGELPFSNLWMASKIEGELPRNSVLHLAILNSLRAWNIFETDKTITCYSNTGGFGIDGCLSSFIGAAKSNPEKQFYGVFGDLSLFYDVNSLINSIPRNVHILLVNNGVGTEFKNYSHIASRFGDDADKYIAAKGHNGFKSNTLIKNYAEGCGLTYLSAANKEEFLKEKDEWLICGGVLLEAFTTDFDESKALKLINSVEDGAKIELKNKIENSFVYKVAKKIIRRG
jgi:2-succinyl-5-enolpyruvyl-6-hydroxy-3-cyclohexene-1-carboxylate synthase